MEKFVEPFLASVWGEMKKAQDGSSAAGSEPAVTASDTPAESSSEGTADSLVAHGSPISSPTIPLDEPSFAENSTVQLSLTIAFASETGTAEAVAKYVFSEVCKAMCVLASHRACARVMRYHFHIFLVSQRLQAQVHGFSSADNGGDVCEIKPLNECALEANRDPTKQKLLVCVCATTGKGEIPANGAKIEATLLKQKAAGQSESLAGKSGNVKSDSMVRKREHKNWHISVLTWLL